MTDRASFITLTYDDEHLPKHMNLEPEHWTQFIKNLRQRLARSEGHTVRFFMAGEYGKDPTQIHRIGRPHFHALIFGWDFPDKYEIQDSARGHQLYRSPFLEGTWTKGYSSVGQLTRESAQYVAKYTLKKVNGDQAENHYLRLDPLSGEIVKLQPEFMRCSNQPGIGRTWLAKYQSDCAKGFITMDGKKFPVPDYYVQRLEEPYATQYETNNEVNQIGRKAITDYDLLAEAAKAQDRKHQRYSQ